MSASPGAGLTKMSEAGIAAEHPPLDLLPKFVAPSTEAQFNTLRPPLRPIACWSIGDTRFKFSSSFVYPEIAEDIKSLASLMRGLEARYGKRPVASVFGHSDPVGNELFNKQLSGRRAAAIYAMLTRRIDIWEDMFSQKGQFTSPLAADEWGHEAIDTILTVLGYASAAPGPGSARALASSDESAKAFQRDHGLAEDGTVGAATRVELFRAYFDRYCRTRKGDPFQMQTAEFLARGEDPSGRGDYQGCSEFNPLLILSKEEYWQFSKPENKSQRDQANQPNRRVVVYFFHPNARVLPSLWPCPRAKDDITGCNTRLWSDAIHRKECRHIRRTREVTHDTFACRFYDRLTATSPCEGAVGLLTIRLRLFDQRNDPIPNAPYRLTIGDGAQTDSAGSDAFVTVRVARAERRCRIEWSLPSQVSDENTRFEFSHEIFLDFADVEDEIERAKRRLWNLGYPVDVALPLEDQQATIRRFQRDSAPRFGLVENGLLDAATKEALIVVHDNCDPVPFSESQNTTAH